MGILLTSLQMAWESVISGKLRSFLTMLGIIIGVLALVVMVSLVNGASGAVTGEIKELGNDMITVSVSDDKGAPIRLEDLSEITADARIRSASPSDSNYATAKRGNRDTRVNVFSVAPSYERIQGMTVGNGRFIRSVDLDNASYVAVLSDGAADSLFDDADPLGQSFTINGRSFLVVGVLEGETSMLSAMMTGTSVYVPYSTGARLFGDPYVHSFCLSAEGTTDEAEKAAEDWLLARLRQDEDAFSLINMSSISDAMDTVTGYLSVLMGSIAAISLLVGGIGIMNIMLVSVTERTTESGVR